jgi:hypothetical protein
MIKHYDKTLYIRLIRNDIIRCLVENISNEICKKKQFQYICLNIINDEISTCVNVINTIWSDIFTNFEREQFIKLLDTIYLKN